MRFHWAKWASAALIICAPTQVLAADAVRLPSTLGFPSPLSAVRAILAPASGPNVLGMTAQPIRAARFSAGAQHAFADASSSPLMQRLIAPARSLNRMQQMAYVQSRVNSNIRWVSDATEWGQHDYWATASETLAHGAGDEEDRAIVKLQALKALGFNQSDLFLTLARDRVGGPITVLMARLNGRYWVLDDTGGAPFLVEERRFEFQPVLSFGASGAWVHSRPQVAAVAVAANGFAHK
jgi:predicted transglutaminase-like cysteine proteinase